MCLIMLWQKGQEYVVGVHGDLDPDGFDQLEVQRPIDQQRLHLGQRHRHAALLLQERRPRGGLGQE